MKVAFYDTKPYDRDFFSAKAEECGLELVYFPFRITAESASTAADCDAICVFVNDSLDADCLGALADQGIKLIALRCAGYNNLDLKTAKSLEIEAVRVPAYSPYAVAEHTVALLQTLNRRIHRSYNRVREHNFSLGGLVGHDLHGKTAGIVGTGKIGKLTAKIFHGYGMEVIAYDLYPDTKWAGEQGVDYRDLDDVLAMSDVVSLHTPLTRETFHLIDAEAIALMKRGAYLVNTSRGKLIDTKALIAALKEKKLGGVALDVYEEEEGVFFEDLSTDVLDDDDLARLLTFPNVLVTSHQAFLTAEALEEIARVTCENLVNLRDDNDFLEGTVVDH